MQNRIPDNILYKDFYNHPFIQSIQNIPKWTFSDENKRPIDIRRMCDTYHNGTADIFGARKKNEYYLMSLTEINQKIQNLPNLAFGLDCLTDHFVVLDIEPACPDKVKQELLQLPYLYGEVSLSGKGYHLVFPLPSNWNEYPIAGTKQALKEENRYYEILLDHYVTFTRNQIPPATGTKSFEEIFAHLAEQAKESHSNGFHGTMLDEKDIPYYDATLEVLANQNYGRSPNDFHNDMSVYEFGYAGFLLKKLHQFMQTTCLDGYQYSEEEQAFIVYRVLEEILPYRPKHEEYRNGLPWLFYIVQEVIAKR